MFMRLEGDKTEGVELKGDSVTGLKDRIQFGKGVEPDVVTITNITSQERYAFITKIIRDYCGLGFSVDIRGPLTVEEVEKESLNELSKESRKDIPKVPFGFSNKRWLLFKGKYRESDEIYYFITDQTSWNNLAGSAGYVLIRNYKVLATIITLMN
jgi:hypothetical protein